MREILMIKSRKLDKYIQNELNKITKLHIIAKFKPQKNAPVRCIYKSFSTLIDALLVQFSRLFFNEFDS